MERSAAATPETGTAALVGEGAARRLVAPILASVPGLIHAFTVRGSEPAAVIREAAGSTLPLRPLRPVPGAPVRTVRAVDGAAAVEALEGDGLATTLPGLALGVRVADCLPILLCDPRSRAIAAVHAGWRGTVAGVLRAAIIVLRDLGARPGDLRVALGPGIGPCCFEVGEEVVERFLAADPEASGCVLDGTPPRIDLVAANRRQALLAGVPAEAIRAVGLCTRCREDLLESYRRAGGAAGRMAGIIAWRT